jgi:hypothetical protein
MVRRSYPGRGLGRRGAALVLACLLGVAGSACGGATASGVDGEAAGADGTRGLRGIGLGQPVRRADGVVVLASVTPEFRTSQRGWLQRLERSLHAFGPDVVLVWVPADAVGDDGVTPPWDEMRPEVSAVVLPWAAAAGAEVVGVSAESERSLAASAAFYEVNPIGPVARDYLAVRGAYHARVLGQPADEDPGWLYTDEHRSLAERHLRHLAYHAEERLGAAGPLRLASRAAGTVEDFVRSRPTQRIVVVVPQDQAWFVDAALRSAFSERVEHGRDYTD